MRIAGCCAALLLGGAPRSVYAQERGAIALGEAVAGLGVTARVLMIGAHPDDEDTFLIAWLSRGRHVRTGYLSLTRGDGGQNLIGNELGEALGVIRTEELLAARRIDGGEQYFTRAFDFGFSKDTIDTYAHWPKDSILGDVVRVVRSMRPHVIIAVFSGTTRDGHGQHQVSGLLAREAYDLAGDTARFPVATHGSPWTPLKFYRAARFNAQAGTVGMNVGEYSPLLGRSYAEIAGESRSQHKSQGFGALQRKGPVLDYLRREASRVNASAPADSENTLFDGIDTTWNRFKRLNPAHAVVIDTIVSHLADIRKAYDAFAPDRLLGSLAQLNQIVGLMCPPFGTNFCAAVANGMQKTPNEPVADFFVSIHTVQERLQRAFALASGVAADVLAGAETFATEAPFPVVSSVHNRGSGVISISTAVLPGVRTDASMRTLSASQVVVDTVGLRVDSVDQPWWLTRGRTPSGGMFVTQGRGAMERTGSGRNAVHYVAEIPALRGSVFTFFEPIVFRFADDVRGEVRREVAAVPAISLTLGDRTQFAPANVTLDRTVAVRVRAADTAVLDARVALSLPPGMSADSAARSVRLNADGTPTTLTFRVRGRVAPGRHRVAATAISGSRTFATGYDLIDYEHIRRQRIYRPAVVELSAVDVRVPATLRVGYIAGVSDNVVPALQQLGVNVTVIPPRDLARADLSRFTTLVVGPRAYDANPELVAANARVLEFARTGGTVVVQYGQYEMTQPGIMPFPITINRPHDRVTHEDAPVMLLDSTARELSWPNRITSADFDGWVQERSLYMPRTFDPSYRALLAMSDPGEAPNRGGILVARFGRGTYIYTSMAFFRQLPAGVPGAARLFVNLLSAGLPATRTR